MSFWDLGDSEEVCIHWSKTPYNLCLIILLVFWCLNKNELYIGSCFHSLGIKSRVRANLRWDSWFCHSLMSLYELFKWPKVCIWSKNCQVYNFHHFFPLSYEDSILEIIFISNFLIHPFGNYILIVFLAFYE